MIQAIGVIMQPVSVLPAFVSKDADLKADLNNKELSGNSADSNKGTNFFRLVAQHQIEENKTINGKESTSLEKKPAATDGDVITASGKNDVEETNSSQESDANKANNNADIKNNTNKELPVDDDLKKTDEIDKGDVSKKGSLAESELFISLLYKSDQTLAPTTNATEPSKDNLIVNPGQVSDTKASDSKQNSKPTVAPVLPAESQNSALTSEHKLKVFAKDELLARTQLTNNNSLTQQLSGQALKDYQLSLQSTQKAINNGSITSQQLTNAQLTNEQLANAQLNSKITDVATGVSLASQSKLTENVDSGFYQLPVEPIGKGSLTDNELVTEGLVTKESVAKGLVTKGEVNLNKASGSVKPEGDIGAELAAKKNNDSALTSTKKINNSSDTLPINATSSDLEKTPPMTSEQQTIENATDEFMEPSLLAEEQSVKKISKGIDNIAMRTVSELQAQTMQATQTKQSNDAYFEHQVSEVLNHNVASDTAQIQKNNIQLQQETVSIFRKDFADAVKEKVMITINQKLQRFDITLDPPEFGNMQVRVNLQGEQASVNFIVQNQQAKEALEQNMHKLRDMLSEQGVDVGGANVEQQSQQQNNDEQNLQSNNGNSAALVNESQKDEHDVEHILSAELFDSAATGVDYYA